MKVDEIGHQWKPITDLSADDRASASEELPALVKTWSDIREQLEPEQVDRFNERLKREWAIETGVIERLYTLDQGTTRLLIEQGIDASLIASDATDQPPEFVAGIISDHAAAIDWLFDAITAERPLSTSFVKELHALMTRKQLSAAGVDSLGQRREVRLLHGTYKKWPNNPVRPDGEVHEYCPPEHVDAEMDRLIDMHRAHLAQDVEPDVSAAWLHHRFAQIHPFQDGNGRVSRAIVSLVLISAGWFPLVVTRDDRDRYIKALTTADAGDLQPLIRLVAELERKWFLRALSIAEEIKHETRHIEQVLDAIRDKFRTSSEPASEELERARQTAAWLWDYCRTRVKDVARQLNVTLGSTTSRRAWWDVGEDHDPSRRKWNRYQIIQAARELDYFANTRSFHEWVRLGIITENGRAEILTSFHAIGTEYRGLVGVSMCFYRRQQDEDGENQVIELQPVSDDVFQINYAEAADSVQRRFESWLEESLALGLDQWRRGE